LNQWIAAAVAEKVGVIETAADFFKKRAGKAKGDGLMKFLRNAPQTPVWGRLGSRGRIQNRDSFDASRFKESVVG